MTTHPTDDQATKALLLKAAAEQIADATTELGQRARAALAQETGLSEAGVDLALAFSLEHEASRATVLQLCMRIPKTERSHVLLSANVFVGAYRAILISVLHSEQCFVRASRRSRVFSRLLHEAAPGAFELVPELNPQAGDHLWAYAHDDTLAELRTKLPSGVRLHAHGSGMGAAVLAPTGSAPTHEELDRLAADLTTDIVLFDQRGCLSPRVLFIQGTEAFAADFQGRLVRALDDAEKQVPRGVLDAEETASARRYEATFRYVGGFTPAGKGAVTLDPEPERVVIPPVGRFLHITRTASALARLSELGPRLTAVASFGQEKLPGLILQSLGPRRVVAFGELQRPPLDGPIDLRAGVVPEIIGT